MIRPLATVIALLGALGLVSLTTAADVELPGSPGTTLNPGDRPAGASTGQTAPTTKTTKKRLPLRMLRMGSRGEYVKDLQRALRKRGIRVRVDGVYGSGTRRGVKIMQKRLRIRATGVAKTGLQRRLGVQPRKIAVPVVLPLQPGANDVIGVFPVGGKYTYTNDFGAPRHQGAHEGIDIIAPRGTPVYAVKDGVVDRLTRAERGLGGLYVWQRTGDGTEYYYAHLDSVAPGLRDGSRLTAGQIIGAVGNTGDARFGVHHLHFEWRPKGSSLNPYRFLVAADPNTRPRTATRRN
ncbi:MAG: M23 family metallopeptidase [Miltoncostaeaceae bacterium]